MVRACNRANLAPMRYATRPAGTRLGPWQAAVLALGLTGCLREGSPPPPAPRVAAAPSEAKSAPPPPAEVVPEPIPALPQAGPLHYYERILGEADADAELPMIVAIHGLGDDPVNFSHLFDLFPAPVRLIAPQAPSPTEGGGWSWFPLRARDPDVQRLSEGMHQASELLSDALEVLVRERPTLGRPVVTGFSQGGMLTLTLAIEHPEQVAAAVAVGGWLPPPLWPASPPDAAIAPPIVALHGTADTAVRFEPTQQSLQHLQAQGFDVKLVAYEGVPHVISPEIHRDMSDALIDAVDKIRARAKAPEKTP